MKPSKPAHRLVLEEWGREVRAARKALDLSQTAAAERLGMDQSTLSRIETGNYRLMHPELILHICLGLRIESIDAFRWPTAIVDMAQMKAAAEKSAAA